MFATTIRTRGGKSVHIIDAIEKPMEKVGYTRNYVVPLMSRAKLVTIINSHTKITVIHTMKT
ncbi:hypothetical protein GGGNBK_12185 [Sporosarcina sp. ANT_H38]